MSRAESQPRSEQPLLEAANVRFAYPGAKATVCDASLRLERGKLAALIGPNGCGKSTLLRLLLGALAPHAGEVLFEGRPLREMPKREVAQRVAYVPQSTQMIFPFTVLEVVLTGRSPYSSGLGFESAQDRDKARQALRAVGAGHLEARRFTELSGGERQLVAFARALAQEPECLLLDEPSAALDLKHRAEMIRLLRLLRDEKGLTALLVTHDLQLLDPGFDWIFAMRLGAVLAQGPAAEILNDRILSEVYEDPTVHAIRHGGRTFVWSEC